MATTLGFNEEVLTCCVEIQLDDENLPEFDEPMNEKDVLGNVGQDISLSHRKILPASQDVVAVSSDTEVHSKTISDALFSSFEKLVASQNEVAVASHPDIHSCNVEHTFSSPSDQRNANSDVSITDDVINAVLNEVNGEESKSVDETKPSNKKELCLLCGKVFVELSRLARHMKFHARGHKIHYCSVCGLDFDQKSHLGYHMVKHTGEKRYSCEICGIYFSQRPTLNSHVKKHTSEPRLPCEKCGKKFWNNSKLKYHVAASHDGIKPFQCPVCGKCFATKSSLQTHSVIHPPFPCKICGENFDEKNELNLHNATHTGPVTSTSPFICSVCGKQFAYKHYVRLHAKIHEAKTRTTKAAISGEFPCKVCGRNFSLQRYLTFHSKVHSAGDKHKCKICGLSYAREYFLKSHMMAHSDEKRYACKTCGRKYNNKGCLVIHERTHSNVKHYACEVCGKKFFWKNFLKSHMRRHKVENQKLEINKTMQESSDSVQTKTKRRPRTNCKKKLPGGANGVKFNLMNGRIIIGPIKLENNRMLNNLSTQGDRKISETSHTTPSRSDQLTSNGKKKSSNSVRDDSMNDTTEPLKFKIEGCKIPLINVKLPEMPQVMTISEGQSEPFTIKREGFEAWSSF